MRIADFDTEKKVLVIAEIGNNHEGNFDLANEMIEAAADCGVDAVKFQTIKPELLVNRSAKERFDKLKSFEFSYSQFEKLATKAKKHNLLFLSTPCDLESADFLNDIVPAFKIASSDNTFFPLIDLIASKGKPILLSCGLASIGEIKQAKRIIEDVWNDNNLTGCAVGLLYCILSYPAEPEDINLNVIKTMLAEFGSQVGYSDHAIGIDTAPLAVAMGARIIEKHFTIDHNYSDFRDHQLSADISEMKQLVEDIRKVELLLGSPIKKVQKGEAVLADAVRRSIAARKDIPAGTKITMQDIKWLRPSGGIPPGKEHLVLGKTAKYLIPEDQVLHEDMVD